MQNMGPYSSRRSFLAMLVGGVAGLSSSMLLRQAAAMGFFEIPMGMYRIDGEVEINGIAATIGSPVNPGDVITTGESSLAIFLIGKDVYLLREHSRLYLEAGSAASLQAKIADVIRMTKGQLLAVFGEGEKRVVMPTATVGVRGTGIYMEPGTDRSYYCNCYGTAEIVSAVDPTVQLTVETVHHEAPVFIYSSRSESETNQYIEKAPVYNHSDAELIMLESIVFRKPAFHDPNDHGRQGY